MNTEVHIFFFMRAKLNSYKPNPLNNVNNGGDSASSLLIKSYNVNSIGKNPKRSEIFRFLRKKGGDIQVLLDTRFSKEIEPKVKEEWGAPVYFSSFSSQSRGVAIFLKKTYLWKF